MFGMARLLALLGCVALAAAHTQITYPGERGNNLHTNGTAPQDNPNAIGVDWDAATGLPSFPYGMQWIYPCTLQCNIRENNSIANERTQAAVCLSVEIAQSGHTKAAPYPSSPAGTKAIKKPCSTSTWVSAQPDTKLRPTCRISLSRPFKLLVLQMRHTQDNSVSHRSPCQSMSA